MAGRLGCCLNLLPLPNTNSPQSSKPFLRRRSEEETRPRRSTNSCLVGLAACVVLAAAELTHVVASAAVVAPPRWSEKRMCPPWLQNSLETIVPENLPRPSSRRRWESVGMRAGDAPPVVSAVGTRANRVDCFTM